MGRKKWKQIAAAVGAWILVCGNCGVAEAVVIADMPPQYTEQQDASGVKPAEGWVWEGRGWHYYRDGVALTDTMTPDGYFVDSSGLWEQKTLHIVIEDIKAPERFRPSTEQKGWAPVYDSLNRLNEYLYDWSGLTREFSLYEDAIVYNQLDGDDKTELLSLHKMEGGGYQLRLSTTLVRNGKTNQLSSCDYQVFRFFCAAMSSTPDQLVEAVYGSWQSSNPYGLSMWEDTAVGDAWVRSGAEQGTGVYSVSARGAGQ